MNELDTYPPSLASTAERPDTSKTKDATDSSSRPGSDEAEPASMNESSSDPSSASSSSPSDSSSTSTQATVWHPSYWFLLVVSVLTMVADLATKAWAEHRLDRPESYLRPLELIPGHLDFVLAKNRGGAWGLFQDTSESIRRPFFLLVSAAAIAFIVTLYRRLGPQQRALRWGLPLVLGGALGNLVDRIRYSYVIDFIHMHARWGGHDHHWPTYNVADIAICVGVGLMAIDMFGPHRTPRDSRDSGNAT